MWTRRLVSLPPSTPKQYTFVAVPRMERMLWCCKDQSVLQSCRRESADKIMSARSTLQTYATCPDGFEACKISLGAAVFSGFCKYCVSSCSLDVLQSLNFPNDYQFFLHMLSLSGFLLERLERLSEPFWRGG